MKLSKKEWKKLKKTLYKNYGDSLGATLLARTKIIEVTGGKPKSRGKCKCPVCKVKNQLHYVIMANGHVHAHCKTSLCVNWME